ncbi:ABC transporter transmembrane domain-containing protein [Ammoniphilus resinae]|uniref:ATP-binding cassette subfamily B protein n=1 Tax=Ammoniphilus resinae TaxID=861532 RepID=A0ABS4GJU7_9BACL|nr:ABC transporter transmembrane domain-containing protein [Ammoniphilus resinae]MBP1930190.1 ATP-binding cassette subfamily B protein [Ammoniphilus resinae]
MILLRIIRRYLTPFKFLYLLFIASILIEVGYAVAAPLSLKYLVDYAFVPKDGQAFILILSLLVFSGLFNIAAGASGDYLVAKLSGYLLRELRIELFSKLQRQSLDFFSRHRVGDITTRFNSDLLSIERVIGAIFPLGFKEGITVFLGLGLLFSLQWKLALAVLIGSSLLFIGPRIIQGKAETANRVVKEAEGDFASTIDESLKGHKTIKGLHLQEILIERARKQIHALFALGLRKNFMNSLLERIPMTSLMVLNAIMIGFGGFLIFRGELSIGEFVAFFTLFMSVGQSVFHLTFFIPAMIESNISFERVSELLDEHPTVSDVDNPVNMLPLVDEICMHNVTFGYGDGPDILKNVSFHIPAGSFATFVGSSGSGKSTALQLLMRFYDPREGSITFDGVDLRKMSEKSLREQVGVVFQDTFLFNATVRENLQMGRSGITEEEMIAAAKAANIHETIMAWPQGYDTPIVQEGASLSGGQRQRLSIARSLLRKPKILLLDEVTSALDPSTEGHINQTIEGLKGTTTTISVTHRLSSIVHADLIFVFHDGRIVEIGSHKELLDLGGLYFEMWEKQAGFSFSLDGMHAKVDVRRLGKIPIFQGLEKEPLLHLATLLTSETYERGKMIVREGDEGDKFYLIARGSVEVRKQFPDGDRRVAVLQEGDHFGEIALLKNIPRTASIITTETTVLLSLRREWFLELTKDYPQVMEAVEQTLTQRMN